MRTPKISRGINVWQCLALVVLWIFELRTLETIIDSAIALNITMDDMWGILFLTIGFGFGVSAVIVIAPLIAHYLDTSDDEPASKKSTFHKRRRSKMLPDSYEEVRTETFGKHTVSKN